jgi:hypothetical protein
MVSQSNREPVGKRMKKRNSSRSLQQVPGSRPGDKLYVVPQSSDLSLGVMQQARASRLPECKNMCGDSGGGGGGRDAPVMCVSSRLDRPAWVARFATARPPFVPL